MYQARLDSLRVLVLCRMRDTCFLQTLSDTHLAIKKTIARVRSAIKNDEAIIAMSLSIVFI